MGTSSSFVGSSKIFFTDRLPVGLLYTFSAWKVLEGWRISKRGISVSVLPSSTREAPSVPVMPVSRRVYSYRRPSGVYLGRRCWP